MSKMLLSVLATMVTGLSQAASVDVTFVDPDRYADGGEPLLEAIMVKTTLTDHFSEMALRFLPAGQRLKVDVTDIDLAGEIRYSGGRPQNKRLVRGTSDFPRINLHYELLDGDKLLAAGDARVVDMNYSGHIYSVYHNEPLFYERRMLEAWFRQQFAAASH